jgi:hypothetical protein
MVILLLVVPRWFPWLIEPRRVQVVARQAQQQEPPLKFMMVAPRVERPVAKAPERSIPSDLNRAAASPERSPKPENMQPFSRGNSPEMVDQPPRQSARGPFQCTLPFAKPSKGAGPHRGRQWHVRV